MFFHQPLSASAADVLTESLGPTQVASRPATRDMQDGNGSAEPADGEHHFAEVGAHFGNEDALSSKVLASLVKVVATFAKGTTTSEKGMADSPKGRATSLEGIATFVTGMATFMEGRLTSLKGTPTFVGGMPASSKGRPTFLEGSLTFVEGRPTFWKGMALALRQSVDFERVRGRAGRLSLNTPLFSCATTAQSAEDSRPGCQRPEASRLQPDRSRRNAPIHRQAGCPSSGHIHSSLPRRSP